MISLQRNKRKLYLCSNYKNSNGIIVYKTPIIIYENYQPTNSDGDLIGIGLNYPEYLRIKSSNNQFKAGDRCYIYIKPPLTHDEMCKNADYEVYTEPMESLNSFEIRLKKLSGKK